MGKRGRKPRFCEIEGCGKPRHGRGFCDEHYARWRDQGDPLAEPKYRLGLTADERFDGKVDKSGECWIWTGTLNGAGYGTFRVNGRTVGAHRFAYEREHGPIPEGLELDHTCEVTACVRPSHLEPVTHKENVRRARSRNRSQMAPTS